MRIAPLALFTTLLSPQLARAGELDLNLGLQATTTEWEGDHGGGPSVSASWFFQPWIGVNFTGKEHYAPVDERFMSYYSVNAIFRKRFEHVVLAGTAGFVHQHEEGRAAIEAMPVESIFGVADGTRHRMASRSGLQLAVPISDRDGRGSLYFALDLDATVFADADRGPRWMSSAGLSVGVTHDFAQRAPN